MSTTEDPNLPPYDVSPPNDGPSMALSTQPPMPSRNTANQARIDTVARTMDAAMNKASTLTLTPEEVVALKADFPDEAFKPGAAGKEHLIYIEHAFLRDRMDEALGMGQWAIIRTRPLWAEDFRTGKGENATPIYADCALLVRGCMVSEAIGDMVYYPNNATQNYGDAAEGAMTAAFRRCAKNFGIGLQAWKKDFGNGWWERQRDTKRSMSQHNPPMPPTQSPAPATRTFTPQPSPSTPRQETPVESKPAAPKLTQKERADAFIAYLATCKSRFLSQVKAVLPAAEEYFRSLPAHGIMPGEPLSDLPASSMFPSVDPEQSAEANHAAARKDFDAHMAGIKRVIDGNNELPMGDPGHEPENDPGMDGNREPEPEHIATGTVPLAKPLPPGTEAKRIRVKVVTSKDGTSAKGPWTRFGICDANDTWYNSFDRTLGAKAKLLKGQDVTIWFKKEGEYGNTFHEIEPV